MTLYDYISLMPDGEELTVWDKDYDIEVYFYGGKPDKNDKWEMAIDELSHLLTIERINSRGVTINLSEVIEKHINKIKEMELFYYDEWGINEIMEEIESILAGNTSEEWLEIFVDILSE